MKIVFPDDLTELPSGSVINGSVATTDVKDVADYVVIGSGAAGASSALILARAGYSVVILEEGPWVRTRDFGVDVYPAMKSMFREMGTNVTSGRAFFPVLQGRCVGGSTTINSAIAWRVSESIIHQWTTRYGIKEAITYRDLESQYDELDRVLSVRPVDDKAMGNHNTLFGDAAAKLRIKAQKIERYDGGCGASASCITGCRTAKKLSMNVTFVPDSLKLGAKIYTSARASRVKLRYGRAQSVQGTFSAPGSPSFSVIAKRGVILAASAVQTPGILKRSGVRLPAVGKHFQLHNGTSLPARFDRDISMHIGATQGFNSMHFVDSDRFKIETVSLPPELLAIRIPGVGNTMMRSLLEYKNILNWAVIVRTEAEGQIRSVFGRDIVQITPTPTDMARARRGLRVLSEMMFAAGAKEVFPDVRGVPTLKSADDLRYWDNASLDPRDYGLMASHLFGSARMGTDPRFSVVGLDFQTHGVRGLYVLDSSIFPTNIGVNPQHTIMAIARLGATRIVDRPLPSWC